MLAAPAGFSAARIRDDARFADEASCRHSEGFGNGLLLELAPVPAGDLRGQDPEDQLAGAARAPLADAASVALNRRPFDSDD